MNDHLTPERLTEIRERAAAANDDIGVQYSIPADEWMIVGDKPTARLLMHAPADVPDLLAEVDRLRTGIEALASTGYSHVEEEHLLTAGDKPDNWHPDCGRCWGDALNDLIYPKDTP